MGDFEREHAGLLQMIEKVSFDVEAKNKADKKTSNFTKKIYIL